MHVRELLFMDVIWATLSPRQIFEALIAVDPTNPNYLLQLEVAVAVAMPEHPVEDQLW